MPGRIIDSKTDTHGTLASLPCALPSSPIPQDCDAEAVVANFADSLLTFDQASFREDVIWRDSFALTGTLRTFYSYATTSTVWRKLRIARDAHSFAPSGKPARINRLPGGYCWVEGSFMFQTSAAPASLCTLIVSLTPAADGEWQAWMLGTILDRFRDCPSPDELTPVIKEDVANISAETPISNGNGRVNGHVNRDLIGASATSDTECDPLGCVVVGAGQAGLSVAGRLQALGVSYVVLDKHANVGDSWKLRYDSARLHTTRQWAHLPFDRTFPADCQEYLTKDDLATGHIRWVKKYGIKVWNSATLTEGSWDPIAQMWTLTVRRDGSEQAIRARSVVLATGPGGTNPMMPKISHREAYHGDVMHSVDFRSAAPWRGQRGIVVGTANTGHDVAKDMFEAGCSSVTMIQRSTTYVMPAKYYKNILDVSYNDDTPTSTADMASSWAPIPVIRLISMQLVNSQAEQDQERFDALEKAGFLTQRFGDIIHHIYERNGGHYMDVGASAMIAQGKIKVKAGVSPTAYTATGLTLSDGTSLHADVIVWATGFESNTRAEVQNYFGEDVAAQVENYWGIDAEGEIRGAFKPCGHPGLWLHGGTQGQARYMSRFIALQVKAHADGHPLPVYDGTRK